MNATTSESNLAPADGQGSFELPAEVIEIRNMARRIVREELMPMEPQYLAGDHHSYGASEGANLAAVFGDKAYERLKKISVDTGLWNMGITEEYGGSGLGLLAQAVVTVIHYIRATFAGARFVTVPSWRPTSWLMAYARYVASGAP